MPGFYEESLVAKTNPDPYDQIIVLCQKMINEAFRNMWCLASDESPLSHFEYVDRMDQYIKTSLGAPRVELQVTNADPQLYYCMTMTNGSLKIFTTNDSKKDDHIEWQIQNWVFAFSVQIGQKKIDKGSAEYVKFKERAGLAESNFSLAQLFIDASSTTKWNEQLSSFGDKQSDWKSLGAVARSTFETFIQKWLNLMKDQNANILGYTAQSDKNNPDQLNPYAPSFPPTSIEYHSYPWLDPSAEKPVRRDNIDQNAISYLMVNGFRDQPLAVGLPYSGTFVKDKGLYCMNRKIFWDSWLLKQLGKVLKMMELIPDKPDAKYIPENGDHPWHVGVLLHFGNSSGADSDYVFKDKTTQNMPHKWIGIQRSESRDVPGDGVQATFTETSRSFGDYSFGEGHETVAVSGGNDLTIRFQIGDDFLEFVLHSIWQFKIAMSAVQDGGIVFKKVLGSDSAQTTMEIKHPGNLSSKVPIEQMVNNIRAGTEKEVQKAYASVEDNLLHALANQHKLFLPAKGTFLMKDPKFNRRGDLLVALEYNGADPPSNAPKTTKAQAKSGKQISVRVNLPDPRVKPAKE